MPRNSETIARARMERRELTSAEAKIWSLLRSRRFKQIKFRRQHAIGPYVVDFACPAARLVLEVDGPNHSHREQMAFDARRTAFLESAGWYVARITNDLALHHLGHAALAIEDALYMATGFKKVARAAQYEEREEYRE